MHDVPAPEDPEHPERPELCEPSDRPSPSAPSSPVGPFIPRLPSPLQEVTDERFGRRGVRLLLKRDDLIHPELTGNKWRKLAPNLTAAAGRPLLTFGGAWSHHLAATATAGRLLGIATTAVVRGDELATRPLNPVLSRCVADGMRLHFVDRSTYRRKNEPDTLARLRREAGAEDHHVVPEGGSNALAVRGCAALGAELGEEADVVALACGTGGTLAGLGAGLAPGRRALGIAVVGGGHLEKEVAALQQEAFGDLRGTWQVESRFTLGGYARTPAELHDFAEDFTARHGLPLERLYVAKALLALLRLTEEGAFAPGTRLALVVTGPPPPPPSTY